MDNKITELRELALNIETRRVQLDLSKNALCQKFGQLGSTKTYGRILDGGDDLTQLNIAGQLENYRAAWELIQSCDDDPEQMRIYSDFEFVEEAMAAVAEAMQQTDNTRLVLVTAGSGGGKSTVLDWLKEDPKTSKIFYKVEATEAWRMREGGLLGALLMEVGSYDGEEARGNRRKANYQALPIGANARLRQLIELIDGRRIILGVDEFHHIGPAGYNIIKTIINQTRAVVVAAGMPELIARINKNSHSEAKQLFHNRLFKHVSIGTPSTGEVLEYLKRRGVKFAGPREANAIAEKLSKDSATYGLWKFVKRCANEARKKASHPFSLEAFAGIIAKVKANISLA
jgi:hypothetical protein